ncbi:hypothetical protein SB49_00025 [Sediminicola sp. YIK13]|uniref:formylglycine-generating enzyme family protein n=1 Tax=Sediminicola sp. YIK13 TaxID=1453352 RepID=UPI00071F34AE|nr:SUMF1/EgtB/PvdO family nonheme iron enzyme [Sediminicola sp. YIK13]ALM06382.1 hypothetical protein SB49_00025 [Sediminicola sp. YIK13]
MLLPAPVGSFEPNKLGVCDINGNIWEWCSDWYGAYSNQKMIDPQGPISGKNKVGRGASYDCRPLGILGQLAEHLLNLILKGPDLDLH